MFKCVLHVHGIIGSNNAMINVVKHVLLSNFCYIYLSFLLHIFLFSCFKFDKTILIGTLKVHIPCNKWQLFPHRKCFHYTSSDALTYIYVNA